MFDLNNFNLIRDNYINLIRDNYKGTIIIELIKKWINFLLNIIFLRKERIIERHKKIIEEMMKDTINNIDNILSNMKIDYDYMDNVNKVINDKVIDQILCRNRYDIFKYELSKDKYNIDEIIKDIVLKINNYLYTMNIEKRIIYDDNESLLIEIDVSERIKNKIWQMIEPYNNKFLIDAKYIEKLGITIDELQNQFQYIIERSNINIINGYNNDFYVFRRTTLAKLTRILNFIEYQKLIN